MRDFLLAAIIISLFAMLFEGFIVFRNLKNKLHAYLFLNCIVMLASNTGYLLELLSIKIPKVVVGAFILIDAAVYSLIFTLQDHVLYYSKIWFDKSGCSLSCCTGMVLFIRGLCNIRLLRSS